MPKRNADAVWKGDLKNGTGTVKLGSGAFEGMYSFGSRFEEEVGTNPEELIGAAHAGCFSMALSGNLSGAGYNPESIETQAEVQLKKEEAGFTITTITLNCTAQVSDIDEAEFKKHAEDAKKGCPVSRALTGVSINLNASLK